MVKVLKLDSRDVSDILEEVNIVYLPEDDDLFVPSLDPNLTF